MPHACVVAELVITTVKENPRRRSSRNRVKAGVQEGMSAVLAGPVLRRPHAQAPCWQAPCFASPVPPGASWPGPMLAYRQTGAASPPGGNRAAPALRIAALDLRPVGADARRRPSAWPRRRVRTPTPQPCRTRRTRRGSSPAYRMVSQDRPDWNTSRQSFSKIPWSSQPRRPHSLVVILEVLRRAQSPRAAQPPIRPGLHAPPAR